MRFCEWMIVAICMCWVSMIAEGADVLTFPGNPPGEATVVVNANEIALSNAVIEAAWTIEGGRFRLVSVVNMLNSTRINTNSAPFTIMLGSKVTVSAVDMTIIGKPEVVDLKGDSTSVMQSKQFNGKALQITLRDINSGLQIRWKGLLRDESNYIRQEVMIMSVGGKKLLKNITMLELENPGARREGTVDGSPVVADDMFFALEHPLSQNDIDGTTVSCQRNTNLYIEEGKPFTSSVVFGVVPPNQLRRGFLYYLERERAHPYRQYLHYNSWYDLNISRPKNRMTEAEALDAIHAVGEALVKERGVDMDGFVLDDGWDSHMQVWGFHEGFPNGFRNVKTTTNAYGAGIGVWMSPWGGYGEAKNSRLQSGRAVGLETNTRGFSMAGENYKRHFKNTCLKMMRDYDVNSFKFDGMGAGNAASGASAELAADIEAILAMVNELREADSNVFINATVGTWPSPFWTRYADAIWRQGEDTGFAGVGNQREQWITYRDKIAHDRIVQRGPLYPLNSLMFHGVVIGSRANPGLMPMNENSVRHEIRAAFGCGSGLQELYITPKLLTKPMWDDLADAAKWSRQNQDILVDTHWIGGAPSRLEVYGWAAWNQGKGILVLRNPNSQAQNFSVDVSIIFELPLGATNKYTFRSPYKDQAHIILAAEGGKPFPLKLDPFEVLVLNAYPVQ